MFRPKHTMKLIKGDNVGCFARKVEGVGDWRGIVIARGCGG